MIGLHNLIDYEIFDHHEVRHMLEQAQVYVLQTMEKEDDDIDSAVPTISARQLIQRLEYVVYSFLKRDVDCTSSQIAEKLKLV
jgi:hypothetical protein